MKNNKKWKTLNGNFVSELSRNKVLMFNSGVTSNFKEKVIFQKRYTIFIPYLEERYCESNFKYLCKKYLVGVSGTCVIYGPELLICRPSIKQLSLHTLSRKLKFFYRISWGSYAIKQIYIF